jgi:LEA14-like dessication related protein
VIPTHPPAASSAPASLPRRHFLLRFTPWVLLAAGSGCATTRWKDFIRVHLVSIDGQAGGLESLGEVRMDLTLRIENSSGIPLTLYGSAHQVRLNGIDLGEAMGGERIEIPRLGSTTTRVSLNLSTLRLARALVQIRQDQHLTYQLNSRLLQSEAGWFQGLRKETSGRLDWADFRMPSLPGF